MKTIIPKEPLKTEIIEGIKVETAPRYYDGGKLFCQVIRDGKPSSAMFRNSLLKAYKTFGVGSLGNPTKEQCVKIAKLITDDGYPCKVDCFWGSYAF